MSETIDEIEDVLLEKKETILATAKGIRQRLDPFYKARERPLPAVGIVFGVGLLLGVLTGGRKRMEVAVIEAPAAPPPPRSDLWERRARRLLRIARQQQEELAAAREPQPEWEEEPEYEEDYEDDYYSPDDYDDEEEIDLEARPFGLRDRLRGVLGRHG